MAKQPAAGKRRPPRNTTPDPAPARAGKPSSVLDTRVIYCGDNLEQLVRPARPL